MLTFPLVVCVWFCDWYPLVCAIHSSSYQNECFVFAGLTFQMNLLHFKFQDEQPDVQGLAVLLSSERYATNSPIGM